MMVLEELDGVIAGPDKDQIIRLMVMDYKGRKGEMYASFGERVYAYHPKHIDGEEECTMFPETGGIMFLHGRELYNCLNIIERTLDKPLDYVMLRGKRGKQLEPLLHLSEVVDNTLTTIATIR